MLVMLAGSVVRMTGSGMGCPDWPKCFGYTIPPTGIETLTWAPNRSFDEGNIIIIQEKLLVATSDFVSTEVFPSSAAAACQASFLPRSNAAIRLSTDDWNA